MCRTERSERDITDSCPKDKYKFKLRITNNTNSKKNYWTVRNSLKSILHTLIILFLVSHFNLWFIPCGRLSWLPVSFLLHVKYTLSYRKCVWQHELHWFGKTVQLYFLEELTSVFVRATAGQPACCGRAEDGTKRNVQHDKGCRKA